MIDEVDEALRHLLTQELPARNGEIDIAFNQPKREWSARLSRPTLNLFLFDIRENNKLRQPTPAFDLERGENGVVVQRRKPIRLDLYYMITAWATDPEDEHRLLTRAVMVLARHGTLPDAVLSDSLRDQPSPIPVSVAQATPILEKFTDLWSVLDNEVRPAISCMLTLAVNPYLPITTPAVRSAEVRFGQSARPTEQQLSAVDGEGRFLWIAGVVRARSGKPLKGPRMRLIDKALDVPVQENGEFIIGLLPRGRYTVEVTAEGRKPTRQTLTIPSDSYDLLV
ncbi:MAG: Pvc16 family protein [Anaerolineae bacterium]|nr:Pvc16 family protein [Thermoflexales bacterium]MDW8408168.1 Pvc16 family protein [Anaerolineae bacterium]